MKETPIEKALYKLADFQFKHYKAIIIATVLITAVLAIGLTNLHMQADFTKEMPEDMPVFQLAKEVSSKFGGQDMVVIFIQLDYKSNIQNTPIDIRDPRVIESISALQTQLSNESTVDRVQSVASVFIYGIPTTLDGVKTFLLQVPMSSSFFNKAYSITPIYAYVTSGSGEEKVKELTDMIDRNIESVQKPAGVKYKVTGSAPMIVVIMRLLGEDAFWTTLLAIVVVLIMLIILTRSFVKSFLVLVPLTISIEWLFGGIGLMNIPLSIPTVMIGAVTTGLGVEFGMFMVSRYEEERANKTQQDALRIAVSGIGTSVFGSATTTIAGFLALTITPMPMIQHLGVTLALGIALCWACAVFVNPCLIVWHENRSGKNG
jgi:hypothetical protein